uniref:Uncharacterized protein n=1 Tax=Corvus moneduloides TaxID=1196302 RepID=A0A8U7P8R8_CORMO
MVSAHVSLEIKEEREGSGLASNRFIVRSFATRTSLEGMECDGMLSRGLSSVLWGFENRGERGKQPMSYKPGEDTIQQEPPGKPRGLGSVLVW